MIEEGEGAKAMSPGWWFDRAEGIGVEVVVSCVHLCSTRARIGSDFVPTQDYVFCT